MFTHLCPSAGVFRQKGRAGDQANGTSSSFALWRGLSEQRANVLATHVGYLCVITHK